MAVQPASVKRINRQNKTVELEDGRTLPLPKDLAFELLGSDAAKEKSKGIKESTVELNKSFPLGKEAGAFKEGLSQGSAFVNLATKYLGDPITESIASVKKGPGQEKMSFFERLSENLQAVGKGRREGQEQIGMENPKSYLAGKVGGIGVDLGVPLPKAIPKNPIAQGAILGGAFGAGSGEESLLTDPMEAGKDILQGAALGAGVGAVGGKLEKIASERSALRKYPELLQKHKEAASRAEKKFLTDMALGLDKVETQLAGAGIPKSALAVEEFVNKNIGTSAIAGTPQARSLSSFFESIGNSAPNHLNTAELKNIFSAIEGRIANATAEELPLLNSFRQHLVSSLPRGGAEAAVKNKYGSRLLQSFEKEVDSSLGSFLSDKKMVQDLKKLIGDRPLDGLATDLKRFAKSGYEKITPGEFLEDLKSGNFKDRMMWFFDNNQKVQEVTGKIEEVLSNLNKVAPIANLRSPEVNSLVKARDKLVNLRADIQKSLINNVRSNVRHAAKYEGEVANKLSKSISDAVGEVNPMSIHTAPANVRPVSGIAPGAPITGKAAQFFETPNFYKNQLSNLFKLKGKSGLAKVGYLATGLPGVKVGATVAAGAGGLASALRGATSPTALGAFARSGIQKGGIRMIIESIAYSYPSYQNGVLQDPQDRRSAAAQIEQDQDLSLEDKAMLQTKINRGVNLETLIREEE